MKTIVFIFMPVYVKKNGDALFQATPHREDGKAYPIQFSQGRQSHSEAPPFWTWFIENPRPSSLHRQ